MHSAPVLLTREATPQSLSGQTPGTGWQTISRKSASGVTVSVSARPRRARLQPLAGGDARPERVALRTWDCHGEGCPEQPRFFAALRMTGSEGACNDNRSPTMRLKPERSARLQPRAPFFSHKISPCRSAEACPRHGGGAQHPALRTDWGRGTRRLATKPHLSPRWLPGQTPQARP